MVRNARIDEFLALAEEFSQEGDAPKAPRVAQASPPSPLPVRQRTRRRDRQPPTSGVVRQTADAIIDHMLVHGEGQRTRDLVPIVEAAGVTISGKNKVATLSARIFTSQMFERRGSGWFIRREADEETAGNPGKDAPAGSLFHSNQGGSHGPALA